MSSRKQHRGKHLCLSSASDRWGMPIILSLLCVEYNKFNSQILFILMFIKKVVDIMYDKNQLTGIYPFNEAQKYTNGSEYNNCFYSGLFSFLISRGKGIIPYISNNIFIHTMNEEVNKISHRHMVIGEEQIPLNELCAQYQDRINYKNVNGIESFFATIIDDINNNNLPCVGVDMFYLPFRKDRYHILHGYHFIFIIGFDFKRNILKIIDNPENSYYWELEISVRDFTLAYTNASRLPSTRNYNYCSFEILSMDTVYKSHSYYRKVFEKNYLKNADRIFDGLESIKQLYYNLQKKINCTSDLLEIKEDLFDMLHYHILIMKQSEKYGFYKIYGDDFVFMNILMQIIAKWTIARDIAQYINLTGKISLEKINILMTALKDVYLLESSFYDNFFSFIS